MPMAYADTAGAAALVVVVTIWMRLRTQAAARLMAEGVNEF